MNETRGTSWAVTVAVYVMLVYTVIAASCSSPQTAEINAKTRSVTLMKWVHVGLAQGVLFALLGAAFEHLQERPVWPPLLGSILAGVLLYCQYQHAMRAGLRSDAPGTET